MVSVCAHVYAHVLAQSACALMCKREGQRTTCRSWFSSTCVLGMELELQQARLVDEPCRLSAFRSVTLLPPPQVASFKET